MRLRDRDSLSAEQGELLRGPGVGTLLSLGWPQGAFWAWCPRASVEQL